MNTQYGPSGETWTHGLLTPSQARSQLRHSDQEKPLKLNALTVFFLFQKLRRRGLNSLGAAEHNKILCIAKQGKSRHRL